MMMMMMMMMMVTAGRSTSTRQAIMPPSGLILIMALVIMCSTRMRVADAMSVQNTGTTRRSFARGLLSSVVTGAATRSTMMVGPAGLMTAVVGGTMPSISAAAADDDNDNADSSAAASQENNNNYIKTTKDFSYAFRPPVDFESTNKPLKTHLEEVNFVSNNLKGYQYGITVDPVRISSLTEFGTPPEVAARVVLAEVNRDGVFDVTLTSDPIEIKDTTSSTGENDASPSYYILEYLSQGKRGDKQFCCKISIQRNKLYVLTAQIKKESYDEKKKEIQATVDSFRVLL